MLPNTALNLKESKRNQIKDFVSVAGPLGVSHFMILTATDNSSYLRVAKTPRVRDGGVQVLVQRGRVVCRLTRLFC